MLFRSGQEKNLTTSSIARMNLVLHGIEDFQIAREDTLINPAFSDASTGGLLTFDCVIANPPFSLKEWGRKLWEADPWKRAKYGIPPKKYGDYAFVQHMIASMASGKSRMAVILPQGALFRKAAEGATRCDRSSQRTARPPTEKVRVPFDPCACHLLGGVGLQYQYGLLAN